MSMGYGADDIEMLPYYFNNSLDGPKVIVPSMSSGTLGKKSSQRLKLAARYLARTSRIMMSCPDVPGVPPLLEKFFDHAQGHLVALSDLFPGAFMVIVRSENTHTQI
jgi:hypothetical protein